MDEKRFFVMIKQRGKIFTMVDEDSMEDTEMFSTSEEATTAAQNAVKNTDWTFEVFKFSK